MSDIRGYFIMLYERRIGLLIVEASRSHLDASELLGFLWTSDRPVAESSPWQHITLTRDNHPCRPDGLEPAIPASWWPQFHAWHLRNHWNRQWIRVKVKCSRYRPGVAQRVGRGIDLLFHDRGSRRGWVVSNTPRPHFTSGKDPLPILQEAGWARGPVWTGEKSRPHRDSIPYRPSELENLM